MWFITVASVKTVQTELVEIIFIEFKAPKHLCNMNYNVLLNLLWNVMALEVSHSWNLLSATSLEVTVNPERTYVLSKTGWK